jgi:hypothetical protein
MPDKENWPAIFIFYIVPIALVLSGIFSQSAFQFFMGLMMVLLSLAGVIAAIGSVLEKDIFTFVISTWVTIYWLIPITNDTFQ